MRQRLFGSIVLNFLLLSIIIFLLVYNNVIRSSFRKKYFVFKNSLRENRELLLYALEHLKEKSFRDLSKELLEKQGVIYGRDFRFFILGELVSVFHIDLQRALKRTVEFIPIKVGSEVISIPSQCSENEFKKIYKFLEKETYPFTLPGILQILSIQLKNNTIDENLLSYFIHSEEFQFFSGILELHKYPFILAPLLRMIIEGDSKIFFDAVSTKNMKSCDFKEVRRMALFSYLNTSSSIAADLLVTADEDFLLHESCDRDLEHVILSLANDSLAKTFLNKVMNSLREDRIKDVAARVLNNFLTVNNLTKVDKKLFPDFRNGGNPAERARTIIEHTVVSGESLSEISEKYKVGIARIMHLNHLSSAVLYPGQQLKIPLN